GADTKNPIVTSSGASGPQSLVATAPSITTEDCNNLVMLFYTNKKNATWTPPTGTTEVYDDPNNSQGLTSNMMSFFIKREAGATGDMSAIASLSEHWVAQAIAIRPLQNNVNSARTLSAPIEETALEIAISEVPSSLEGDGNFRKIIAYPNPVIDRLNINLKGFVDEEPTDNSLVILDAMGRAHAVQRTWFGDESRLEMDFSRMNKGFYIINIRTLQGIKSIRVMKQSQ
ncbi:T9SS type A sorting domain-containing protein, partial [Aquiflexum sp.]|uniref:T9SS type A sorting domain-containing protein n=1 Tax=Aquiflexum sp. TaxID=1872584 RepID=UPI0035948A61